MYKVWQLPQLLSMFLIYLQMTPETRPWVLNEKTWIRQRWELFVSVSLYSDSCADAHYNQRAKVAHGSHCGPSEPEAPSNKQESSVVGNAAPHFKPPKTHFQAPQLPLLASALSHVILSASPDLGTQARFCAPPSLIRLQKWKWGHGSSLGEAGVPWPAQVKTLGWEGRGKRGGEALLAAAGGPRFRPTRPSPTTLNCPCNELLVNGFTCAEALEESVH